MENYINAKIINNIGFGVIFDALLRKTNENVIIKQYSIYGTDKFNFNFFQNEVAILKHLQEHKNIVKYIDSFINDSINQYFIVMENGGDNLSMFLNDNNYCIENNLVYDIIKQILQAIFFIHSKRIIHGDLSLENICINHKNTIKIIDFGFSTNVNDEIHKIYPLPYYKYASPEILLLCPTDIYSYATDIWSIGCVFVRLFIDKNESFLEGEDEIEQICMIFHRFGIPNEFTWPNVSSLLLYNTAINSVYEYIAGSIAETNVCLKDKKRINNDFNLESILLQFFVLNPNERISAVVALEMFENFIKNL